MIRERITCRNPLTYEEILNWLGFAFESSREFQLRPTATIMDAAVVIDDGEYGIAEANRIMDNVVNKRGNIR